MKLQPYQEHMMKMLSNPNTRLTINLQRNHGLRAYTKFIALIRKEQNRMKLLEEAKKLADDIREYAPDTNIELMIRDLIKEIERLQSEKIARS